jgi:hypothetical protein
MAGSAWKAPAPLFLWADGRARRSRRIAYGYTDLGCRFLIRMRTSLMKPRVSFKPG